MKKKFSELTLDDIHTLSDSELTTEEISLKIGIGSASVGRYRKRLGIVVARGSKKGKPKPWKTKRDIRKCLMCLGEFETVPSSSKQYCSKKCVDVYFKSIDRSYLDVYKVTKESTPAYKKYSGRVHRLSQKVYEENKGIINPNNFPRTLCGVEGGYQLDHKVSVRYGFDHGISEEDISKLDNLQIIPWKENLLKR